MLLAAAKEQFLDGFGYLVDEQERHAVDPGHTVAIDRAEVPLRQCLHSSVPGRRAQFGEVGRRRRRRLAWYRNSSIASGC